MRNPIKLSQQLKYFMNIKGLSLSDLSKLSGVPRQTLSDWVEGTSPRDVRQIKKVADVLDTTIDNLCFGDGNPEGGVSMKLSKFIEHFNAGEIEITIKKDKK